MLNYANLNDVEFEYLCQDVMSKKLNTQLRRFAPGRDGGIDLADYSIGCNIIVQVKHYMNSSAEQLIDSLKKEIPKVKENNPKQFYVCCSKQLSPQKVKDIYTLFSDYMESKANIITIIEIEDFLTDPDNIDILKKHYKLWISSTSILEDIFTKDICIDCEALLSNIENDEKFFVQTSAYEHALECLSKNRALFITGDPGVGKTMTSKMLILYFAAQGYRVRYTTDGADLSDLKKSLSQSPESKEIILLDDCLGQAYFNMKETLGNELLSIIKHVNIYKNKLLILNSRVTIYREAQARNPELVRSFENKEYKVYVLNMDAISDLEKARILYNHLFFNCIDKQHFDAIKKDKNYLKIIKHPNYNPRIIEFVSNHNRYEDICPENYFRFIIENLNNPSRTWVDEYERRLSVVDRMLLTTLYSLTNITVHLSFVKQCFAFRIQNAPGIDTSVNQFSNSLLRLQKAFVKIVDVNGNPMLSMVNPSVNDFLDCYLSENAPEKANIIGSCISIRQYKRLLGNEEFEARISAAFSDKSILQFCFENDKQKSAYISFYMVTHKIFNPAYKQFIDCYLSDIDDVNIYEQRSVNAVDILKLLVESELCQYYQIKDYLNDISKLEKLLNFFDLEEMVTVISLIDSLFRDENRDDYIEIAKSAIIEAAECYCNDISSEDYNLDVSSVVESCSYYHDEYGPDIDTDEAAKQLENKISDIVMDNVAGFIDKLPLDLQPGKVFLDDLTVDVSGCDELVDSYIKSDYYDDDRHDNFVQTDYSEIDLIFNR
jgi:hypothetical protein